MQADDDVVFVAGDVPVSRADYRNRVLRAASVLRAIGAGPGDCIGVALRNCPQFFELLAAASALKAFPALRRGGGPPTNMWLYNVGPQWAKRLLFTGDTFTGRLAEKIGFALEAVPGRDLDARVMALANRIAAMGRDIVAINKHVLNTGLRSRAWRGPRMTMRSVRR